MHFRKSPEDDAPAFTELVAVFLGHRFSVRGGASIAGTDEP